MNDDPMLICPALFANLVPLGAMRPEGQANLCHKAAWTQRRAGEFLFRAGDEVSSAYFLFDGRIELRNPRLDARRRIDAGSEAARHRIPVSPVATADALCLTPVRCLTLDRELIDIVLTWEQGAETAALSGEVSGVVSAEDGDDWMIRLLQTPAFQRVPPMHLQAMFLRMESLDAEPGQTVLRQGEPGDYFYVLTHGRCLVTREQPSGKPLQLARLEPGACFGEEALISEAPRNATVTMLTRGSLKRLSKHDFRQLLHHPLTETVSMSEAADLVQRKVARYLDVRLPSEYARRHLPESLNLPLYLLRMRVAQLDRGTRYICVCDTGRRSSVGSFLLLQRGFEACVLAGGLPAEPEAG